MIIFSLFLRLYAWFSVKKNSFWINNPIVAQKKIFNTLVRQGKKTAFGKDFNFSNIKNYSDFKLNIPVKDYEGVRPYIERVLGGEKNVLWPGIPLYFCKTSGTTSGVKYIPISKASMPYHIKCAKDAILSYVAETGVTLPLSGKNIFIQGSPVLEKKNGFYLGRLSGIVAHHVPWYLKGSNLPSFKTNSVVDWEEKVDMIIDETINQNMTLISGIPPWVQMYFEKIVEKTGHKIKDVFPNFSLFIFGGVSFKPYQKSFRQLIGKEIHSIETYPSSEGFIAYQDSQKENGLLLCVNHGIFYEFIRVEDCFQENPQRICLNDVVLGVDYAIVLNSNAGLWGYLIGDVVQFTSIRPYRILISGRVKHFTSAFGEHVIGQEVERALEKTLMKHPAEINEFHVAPRVSKQNKGSYHEWFVEFKKEPEDFFGFSSCLDKNMRLENTYYDDLIKGNVLRPLVVSKVCVGGFVKYMSSIGKLGGQNKVPRLLNDRSVANKICMYLYEKK